MTRLLLLFLTLLGPLVPAAELRVATFNVRYASGSDLGSRSWKARKALVVETIHKMNPDVFGVQEALASQMDYLTNELADYGVIGVGRDDGKRKGEYSAIFYRKECLELDPDDGGTFWLSDTPEKIASRGWGNKVIRICTWARLVDKRTRKGFYFFNTHWDHQNQPSREKAGRLIAQRIDARKHTFESVIVIGDFNATETNPGVAFLLGMQVNLAGGSAPEVWKTPLRSTFLELNPKVVNRNTFNGWKGYTVGPRMIDHILVSKTWKTKKAWIEYHKQEDMVPSDHWPVAAVVDWPK